MDDSEEKQSLDKYNLESKGKNVEYVFFPFVAPFFPPQKELNRLIDMGKGIRNLNYFVYIPKIR